MVDVLCISFATYCAAIIDKGKQIEMHFIFAKRKKNINPVSPTEEASDYFKLIYSFVNHIVSLLFCFPTGVCVS